MPRLITPVDWTLSKSSPIGDANDVNKNNRDRVERISPLVTLKNSRGHHFHVHPIESGLVRIVHSLPRQRDQPRLRNHEREGEGGKYDDDGMGSDGFHWEKRRADWHIVEEVDDDEKEKSKRITLTCKDKKRIRNGRNVFLHLQIDYSSTIEITWSFIEAVEVERGKVGKVESEKSSRSQAKAHTVFLKDFKSAYMFDVKTQRVYHQTCRDQSYMPTSEHVLSANENCIPQKDRVEYLYGLGESKGCMMKDGKRYTMDARDSLGADPQDTDPLYKVFPFYLHYNSNTCIWYGLYYNTLSPSVFDFSAEHDFATGQFRSFSAESGPLDYYVLLGDDGQEEVSRSPSSETSRKSRSNKRDNTLGSIVSQFARLVTPYSCGPIGRQDFYGWQASPTLPPLSQFGYLASGLSLSERSDAQAAVIDYVEQGRSRGFPIDSIHLSSGYAVDSSTGYRNYFTWDRPKYPDPLSFGTRLERDLQCKIIINVKPWLLETHPSYAALAEAGAFIRAAPDARSYAGDDGVMVSRDEDRCGPCTSQPARTMHWSKGMGETSKGSYFDFSSYAGCHEWQKLMNDGVLKNNITGFWIDNNEFSSLIDDEEEMKGEIEMWSIPANVLAMNASSSAAGKGKEVSQRFGWGARSTSVGSVGRAFLTMGMARATFAKLYAHLGDQRPVIVTRSAVPGIQAFAHASWSGDNSTSWLSLKYSTKLSLSVGLTFGPGLYGHDVGGFAGVTPSSELLIRWCQSSMWHTRFTIHSWKEVSTTPWMYGKAETDIIRAVITQRYRLIPMLYSLYVTEYHRFGWPVVKALLWYHSKDYRCLTIDDQFLVGSHVLIAPVCDFGQRRRKVYLPSLVDGEEVDRDHDNDAVWFELGQDIWHRPRIEGSEVEIDAPLEHLPTFIRDGGSVLRGPPVESHIVTPPPKIQQRLINIYPTPVDILQSRTPVIESRCHGSFQLIEDDGVTNAATQHGHFTQIQAYFEADIKSVRVGAVIEQSGFAGTWELMFALPPGDGRVIEHCKDSDGARKDHSEKAHNGMLSVVVTVDCNNPSGRRNAKF